jgi:tetratricopeptide (TPR) repeat protein
MDPGYLSGSRQLAKIYKNQHNYLTALEMYSRIDQLDLYNKIRLSLDYCYWNLGSIREAKEWTIKCLSSVEPFSEAIYFALFQSLRLRSNATSML